MFGFKKVTEKVRRLSPITPWKRVMEDLSETETKLYRRSPLTRALFCVLHPYTRFEEPLFESDTMRETIWCQLRHFMLTEVFRHCRGNESRRNCSLCQYEELCKELTERCTSEIAERDLILFCEECEKKILFFALPFMRAFAAFFLTPIGREERRELGFLEEREEQ